MSIVFNLDKLSCFLDLHIHLDGSLSLNMVKELAVMQGKSIPASDSELKAMLSVSKDCRDLNEYLEKFDFPLSLLQTRDSISKCVELLVKEQEEQGIVYSEIRFAPQLHVREGLSQDEVVSSALEGLAESKKYWHADSEHNLILCCMRGDTNKGANEETVEIAKKYLKSSDGVVAIDLAGAEGLYPTEGFCDIFNTAKEMGVPCTIHAGEAAGAYSVKCAIDLGARRIGHGVRSLEDNKVIELLVEKRIPLELCPTSNLNTRMFDNIADYPILELVNKGVCVTVNTDNMMVSDTSIKEEYSMLIKTFDFDKTMVKRLLFNSVEAAFTSDTTKNRLLSRIEREFSNL